MQNHQQAIYQAAESNNEEDVHLRLTTAWFTVEDRSDVAFQLAAENNYPTVESLRQQQVSLARITEGYVSNYDASCSPTFEEELISILVNSNLADEGFELCTRSYLELAAAHDNKISWPSIDRLYEKAIFIQKRMINYQMTFTEAYLWSQKAGQLLMLTMLWDGGSKTLCPDIAFHIASFLIETPSLAFFRKIKTMVLYPTSVLLLKKILATLTESLPEDKSYYKNFTNPETLSKEQLCRQLGDLISQANQHPISASIYLDQAIATIKYQQRLIEQNASTRLRRWLNCFFKPADKTLITQAYQVALASLPMSIVADIEPEKVEPEEAYSLALSLN